MQLVYGAQVFDIVPTRDEWKSRTAAGLLKPRSAALGQIDTALATFDTNPNAASFNALRNNFNVWYNSKLTGGAFQSNRGAEPLHVRQMLANHAQLLQDRTQLMQNVENQLLTVNWQSRAIWAEIYDPTNAAAFPGALQTYVGDLEWESRLSSGWAQNPPLQVPEWAQRGQTEAANLATWPNLPGGGPGVVLRARMMPDLGIAPANWPRWAPGFARKGLFCHSCAAISADAVFSNRAALQAGLHCPIRSVELVHQQPATVGGMSHWWLCVNRPDEIRFANRIVRFNSFQDYFNYLPIAGGFVVDLWGALFQLCQPDDSSNPAAVAGNCVWDQPDQALLGPTLPRVHARWCNPFA